LRKTPSGFFEFDGLVFKHAVELERDVIEGKLHTGRARSFNSSR
jgi:hypothetical protein